MKIHQYRAKGSTREYWDVLKAIAEDAQTLLKQTSTSEATWQFVAEFNKLALMPHEFSNVSRR